MDKRTDVEKLVQDLQFVKSAIVKSNNIFRFVNISRAIGLVGLWIGLWVTAFAGLSYYLIDRFGTFAAVPSSHRLSLYVVMALFLAAVAIGKIVLVMKHARQTYHDLTLLRLIGDFYRPQTANIVISFITTIVVVSVFLSNRGLDIYLVPVLSILFGLMLIAFLNVFYLRELLVTGDWLLVTGLITMFAAESMHPLLALIITFGLGFPTLYVANRLMGD